jgi:hypothetical protein
MQARHVKRCYVKIHQKKQDEFVSIDREKVVSTEIDESIFKMSFTTPSSAPLFKIAGKIVHQDRMR